MLLNSPSKHSKPRGIYSEKTWVEPRSGKNETVDKNDTYAINFSEVLLPIPPETSKNIAKKSTLKLRYTSWTSRYNKPNPFNRKIKFFISELLFFKLL